MADNGGIPKASWDSLDVDGQTLKAVLLAGVTVDEDVEFLSELTAFEVAYSGYTRKTLTTVNYDETTGVATADEPVWAALAAGDIDAAVIVDTTTGVDATSPVRAFVNFDPAMSGDGGTFRLSWGAEGFARHDDADPDTPGAWQVGAGLNSWDDPGYRLDRGMVDLRGVITGGPTGATILTFDAAYRPGVDITLTVRCDDGTDHGDGDLTITSAGVFTVDYPTGFPNVTLDGIRYAVA